MRNWQMNLMLGAGLLAVALPLVWSRGTDDVGHGAATTAVAAPQRHADSGAAPPRDETLAQPPAAPEAPAARDDLYRGYLALFSADSGERAAALDRVAARPDRYYSQEAFTSRLLEMSADADADVAERATRVLTELIGRRVIEEDRTPPPVLAWEASRTAGGVTENEPPGSFDSEAGGSERFRMLSDQPDP